MIFNLINQKFKQIIYANDIQSVQVMVETYNLV